AMHFLSGGRLPGRELLDSFDDLRVLYAVYGLGFSVMAVILALLLRGERAAGPALVQAAREWTWTYVLVAASGVLSVVVALWGPIVAAPWLPGAVYMLIPAGLPLLLRRLRLRAPAPAPESSAP